MRPVRILDITGNGGGEGGISVGRDRHGATAEAEDDRPGSIGG